MEKREPFFEGEGGLADVPREKGGVIYFCAGVSWEGEGRAEWKKKGKVEVRLCDYGKRGTRRKKRAMGA